MVAATAPTFYLVFLSLLQAIAAVHVLRRGWRRPAWALSALLLAFNGAVMIAAAWRSLEPQPSRAQSWVQAFDEPTAGILLVLGAWIWIARNDPLRESRMGIRWALSVSGAYVVAIWILLIVIGNRVSSWRPELVELPLFLGYILVPTGLAWASRGATAEQTRTLVLIAAAYGMRMAEFSVTAGLENWSPSRFPPDNLPSVVALCLPVAWVLALAWTLRGKRARQARWVAAGVLIAGLFVGFMYASQRIPDASIQITVTSLSLALARPVLLLLAIRGPLGRCVAVAGGAVAAWILTKAFFAIVIGDAFFRIGRSDWAGLGVACFVVAAVIGIGLQDRREPTAAERAVRVLRERADWVTGSELAEAIGVTPNNLAAAVRPAIMDPPTGSQIETRLVGVRGRKEYRLRWIE